MTTIADVLEGRARWCVVEADCYKELPKFRRGAVDHVITDLPYDERTHANARSLKNGGSDIGIDFEPLTDFSIVGDMLMTSRRWVIAFCSLLHFGELAAAAGPAWKRAVIWDRPDGTPQISGDRPAQAAEGIAVLHSTDSKPRWNRGGARGMWRCGVERSDRNHPTPKPIPLMVELVGDFTDPDELILDPFCGSGTTGVACLRLGRRFIGIEKDAKYAAVATERLRAEENGQSLREARAGQLPMFPVSR